MKRPTLQNKQVGVLQIVFWVRKVYKTFEKLMGPGVKAWVKLHPWLLLAYKRLQNVILKNLTWLFTIH